MLSVSLSKYIWYCENPQDYLSVNLFHSVWQVCGSLCYLILDIIFVLFIFWVWVFCLHLCACMTFMAGACGVQMKALDHLELESCQLGAGDSVWISGRASCALSHWDISPASFPGDFLHFHWCFLSEISIWVLNNLDCFLMVLLSRHYVFGEISPILSFLVQFSFLFACLFLSPFSKRSECCFGQRACSPYFTNLFH